ncbi:MAG: tetratricopeptide repeat protein [Bacteroidales bacterium]
MKALKVISSLCLFFLIASGQSVKAEKHQHLIDSLNTVISSSSSDDEIFNSLIHLSYVYNKFDIDKAFESAQEAIDFSLERSDLNKRASAYVNMASLYRDISDFPKAKVYYNKALPLTKKGLDPDYEGLVYNNYAIYFEKQKIIDSALYYYKEAYKCKEKANEYKDMAMIISNIGVLYVNSGNYELAVENFIKALEMKRKYNADPLSISKTYTSIGTAYFRLENYDKALAYYQKSYDIKKENNTDLRGLSKVSLNMGAVYKQTDNLDSAIYFFDKSLDLKKQLNDHLGVAGIYTNLGSLYKSKKQYTKALEYLKMALEKWEEIDNQWGIAAASTNLGNVYFMTNENNTAITLLEQAVKIAEPNDYFRILEEAYYNLSNVHSNLQNYQQSLDYYKKYHKIREDLLDKDKHKRIEQLETTYKTKQQNEIIKRQEAEAKLLEEDLMNSKRMNTMWIILLSLGGALIILLILYIRARNRYAKRLKEDNIDLDRRVEVRTNELQTENDERDRAEKELRESEERYRTLAETVNAGIAIADVNEKILFLNHTFAEMLGYTQSELLDQSLDMIVNDKTFQRFKQETQKRKEGKSNQYFVEVHHKNGQKIDVILTAAPMYNNKGDFVGGVASITDISEFKRAENSVSESLIASEKINNIKNRSIEKINSALRVSLQNIIGITELFNHPDQLNKKQQELIHAISSSAQSILFELYNLNSLTQIQPMDVKHARQDVKLSKILYTAIEQLNIKPDDIQINIESDDLNVYANESMLTNAIGSLLENAHGNSQQKISIKVSQDKVNTVGILEITTEGNRLKNEELERILDPERDENFNNSLQLEKNYNYSLVWIRKIMHILHGRLDVNINGKDGMIITISLPLHGTQQVSDEAHKKVFDYLKNQNKRIIVISSSIEKQKEKCQRLTSLIPKLEHIENPIDFFNSENNHSLPSNSVIILDRNLHAPWDIEKTMLEIKQRNRKNIIFIALVDESCRGTSHLLEIGFHACIDINNCYNELGNFLYKTFEQHML